MCDSDINTLCTLMPKLNHIKKIFSIFIIFFFNFVFHSRIRFVSSRRKKNCISRLRLYEDTVLDILIIRMLMLLIFLLRINNYFQSTNQYDKYSCEYRSRVLLQRIISQRNIYREYKVSFSKCRNIPITEIHIVNFHLQFVFSPLSFSTLQLFQRMYKFFEQKISAL